MTRRLSAFHALLGVSLLCAGCGKGKSKAGLDASTSAGADAQPTASAAADSGPAPKEALKAITKEQVLAQATAAVGDASKLAANKKPDCAAIVDKLDPAFGIVSPKMEADDRPVFLTFAQCA